MECSVKYRWAVYIEHLIRTNALISILILAETSLPPIDMPQSERL